jgi:hypothetical protein
MGEGNSVISSSVGGARMARLRLGEGQGLAVLVLALVALLLWAAPARALSQRGHEFEESFAFEQAGSNALATPSAVAVDEGSGDSYVLDQANNRVVRFGPKHEFLQAWGYGVSKAGGETYETCEAAEVSECHTGLPGYKKYELDAPVAIAVDNASGSPSKGDVYVVANRSWRKPVVDKFSATGAPLARLIGKMEEREETEGAVVGVAVDSAGDVWVDREDEEEDLLLQRFSNGSTNQLLNTEEVELPAVVHGDRAVKPGLAVGADDAVYVTYEPGGTYLEEEESEIEEREERRKDHKEKPIHEQPVKPCTLHTCIVAKILAVPFGSEFEVETLIPELSQENTIGVAVDQSTGLQASGDVYLDHGSAVEALNSAGLLIQDFSSPELQEHAGGQGVTVDATTDEVLLADGVQNEIEVYEPSKPGPPVIEQGSLTVSTVTSSSVDLSATVDPDGAETTYRFEYGTQSCAEHPCAEAPEPPAPANGLGDGFGDQAAFEHVSGLQPETTYHVRVTVEHPVSSETLVSEEEITFKTSPAALGPELPDGRAWEQVSPVLKHGVSLEGISQEGGVIEAAASGKAFTYLALAPLGENEPEGNLAPEPAQIVGTREAGATGWSSQDIAPPEDEKTEGYTPGNARQYEMFSPEVNEAVLKPTGEVPLSEATTERTIYLRKSFAQCAVPSPCFEPLLTAADATAEAPFASARLGFDGATSDLRNVVITSETALTKGAPEQKGMYVWSGGQLQLVSLLPDHQPAIEPELGSAGEQENHLAGISSDGGQIIFTANEKSHADLHLFDFDRATEETTLLDEPDTGLTPSGESAPVFQTASSDGSKVFFTDSQRLASGSSASEGDGGNIAVDLYVSEPGNEAGKRVTDLSADLNPGEAAAVQGGVLGLGEEDSEINIYFVANGVLAEGAKPGSCGPDAFPGAMCNLYVAHYNGGQWEAPRFIARLSAEDSPDWGAGLIYQSQYELLHESARVSPNGLYLAFMSNQRLTGYDNDDAVSGVPDEEVFRYDYETNELVCASCNPTGARPIGVEDVEDAGEGKGLLIDRPETWAPEGSGEHADHWLAANVPGWTATGVQESYYQSRYLLDNGRLFFNSVDALVPRDANKNKADVYEYEPVGLGSCTSAMENAKGGCVALLSSGESEQESAFLDASATGEDVFFLTTAKLAPKDQDTSYDVYDARVCEGTAEPCPAAEGAAPAPPCSSEACKSSYTPSAPFGSPASTASSESGNIQVLGVKESKLPAKKLTKAQLLAKALKSCKKDKKRSKRVACEKQARKKYGAKAKKVARKSSTGGSAKR